MRIREGAEGCFWSRQATGPAITPSRLSLRPPMIPWRILPTRPTPFFAATVLVTTWHGIRFPRRRTSRSTLIGCARGERRMRVSLRSEVRRVSGDFHGKAAVKTGPEWCACAVLKDNCIVFRKVRVYLFCGLALPGVSLGRHGCLLGDNQNRCNYPSQMRAAFWKEPRTGA